MRLDCMQFSRAIYRELSPHIVATPGASAARNRATVLRACEAVVTRLATDPPGFARPARTLFSDIRGYFPMSAQARVHEIVDRYVGFAQLFVAERPLESYAAVRGSPPRCRATTRKGSACQRVALARTGYCPSHQHLAKTEASRAARSASAGAT
jgi:hypothetical protein